MNEGNNPSSASRRPATPLHQPQEEISLPSTPSISPTGGVLEDISFPSTPDILDMHEARADFEDGESFGYDSPTSTPDVTINFDGYSRPIPWQFHTIPYPKLSPPIPFRLLPPGLEDEAPLFSPSFIARAQCYRNDQKQFQLQNDVQDRGSRRSVAFSGVHDDVTLISGADQSRDQISDGELSETPGEKFCKLDRLESGDVGDLLDHRDFSTDLQGAQTQHSESRQMTGHSAVFAIHGFQSGDNTQGHVREQTTRKPAFEPHVYDSQHHHNHHHHHHHPHHQHSHGSSDFPSKKLEQTDRFHLHHPRHSQESNVSPTHYPGNPPPPLHFPGAPPPPATPSQSSKTTGLDLNNLLPFSGEEIAKPSTGQLEEQADVGDMADSERQQNAAAESSDGSFEKLLLWIVVE